MRQFGIAMSPRESLKSWQNQKDHYLRRKGETLKIRMKIFAGIGLLSCLPWPSFSSLSLPTGSEISYTDITTSTGINFQARNSATPLKYLIETMIGGVGVFDYDKDGWLDIFFVNGAKLKNPQSDSEELDKSAPEFWNRLYHNNHDGTFSDVTEKAGLKGKGYGNGVAVGDFDNDGFPDLLVTNYGPCLLYKNNGNGTFTDVTERAGSSPNLDMVWASAWRISTTMGGLISMWRTTPFPNPFS
jgi:FG-GAP-like repeat